MKKEDHQPQLITADALATQLSVSVRTIRAWQAEGRIPYVKLSRGTVRFSLPSVMKALEARTVMTRAVRER